VDAKKPITRAINRLQRLRHTLDGDRRFPELSAVEIGSRRMQRCGELACTLGGSDYRHDTDGIRRRAFHWHSRKMETETMSNYLRSPACTAAVLFMSIGLNACSAASTPKPAASPFPALPPPPMAEPAASCDQAKASWAVGKPADDALLAKILQDTGAKRTRLLKPGMMVTAEFDGTRVNVRVDNNNVVLAVTCG
jgi:hypothetical protein